MKPGEISEELRRLLHYAIYKSMREDTGYGGEGTYFGSVWSSIAQDIWVYVMKKSPDSCPYSAFEFGKIVKSLLSKGDLATTFDFIEFLIRNRKCSPSTKADIAAAFVDSRAAYRVVDGDTIVQVGTDEQALSIERALSNCADRGAIGARRYLISSGRYLRNGEWSSSIRESIHAVESVATILAPEKNTLSAALAVIEKSGRLHGALRSAFDKLYGYASDEKGIRHALAFGSTAKVDEVDALFMYGACAAFVSYLLARGS